MINAYLFQSDDLDQLQPGTFSGTCELASSHYPTTSTPLPTPSSSPTSSNPGDQRVNSRTVQLVSPQYVLYTELEQSRTTFFEKQRAGRERGYTLSKKLCCRLIRNTVTSMNAIKRAAEDDFQYPCSRELTVMAKRLIEYYPILRERSAAGRAEWGGYAQCLYSLFSFLCNAIFTHSVLCFCQESVKKQLLKRVQNVTPAKKKQGATPSRKRRRDISFESSSSNPSSEDTESCASTIILERSPQASSSPEGEHLEGKPTCWDCVLLKLLLVLTRGML